MIEIGKKYLNSQNFNFIVHYILDLKCVLHTGEESGSILPFTKTTLDKCWKIKQQRDETKKRKSKFDAIILPNDVDGVSGYHPKCYKYFQASVKKISQQTKNGTILILFKILFYLPVHFILFGKFNENSIINIIYIYTKSTSVFASEHALMHLKVQNF